jgi:hypothetical protein
MRKSRSEYFKILGTEHGMGEKFEELPSRTDTI